ncbi:MAG TPA: 7-carboxy-7-deazaguanine synthase [Burkholderiales bacterium]|nr:7-carboxy-7-deazaguanine synthase [Burkholderiales bacterium]
MTYAVKELFYSLQGEGINAGRPAVFCRFTGCNLWSGREEDRASAICQFCDTDFVGADAGKFPTPAALAAAIDRLWPGGGAKFVVLTGGEPALQADEPLVEALHARSFAVAVETNGTMPLPPGLDWICVSPKAGTELKVRRGNELKLVFPQPGAEPAQYEALDFQHFLLQPMDGPRLRANTAESAAYCMAHPRWRLSLQTHKVIGIR